MEHLENITAIRCTVLGFDKDYWGPVCDEMMSFKRLIVTYAHSRKDLISFVYDFEPMLILMELTPENIAIATYLAGFHKYRQAFTVGVWEGETVNFKKFIENHLVSAVLQKSDSARKDAMSIFRKFKRYYRYGVNLKSLTDKMPITNDICWHDPSWDERFTREYISNKLDKLGVKRELEGHRYLIAAIALYYSQRGAPEPNKLYTNIAYYYDTTPAAVEKAIRYAIETAWMVGDIDCQHRMFGMSIDEEKGKPTNAEFIARLAQDDYWK